MVGNGAELGKGTGHFIWSPLNVKCMTGNARRAVSEKLGLRRQERGEMRIWESSFTDVSRALEMMPPGNREHRGEEGKKGATR